MKNHDKQHGMWWLTIGPPDGLVRTGHHWLSNTVVSTRTAISIVWICEVQCTVWWSWMVYVWLLAHVIHWRWYWAAAMALHSVACRPEREYESKQGKLILVVTNKEICQWTLNWCCSSSIYIWAGCWSVFCNKGGCWENRSMRIEPKICDFNNGKLVGHTLVHMFL